jgi:ATP-dependent RNA helicase DeaD
MTDQIEDDDVDVDEAEEVEAAVEALDEAPLVQFKQALLDTLTEGGLELYQDLIEELSVETGRDIGQIAAAAARLARRAQAPNALERIAAFELDSVGKLDQRNYVPRPAQFQGGGPRRGGSPRGGFGRSYDRPQSDRGFERSDRGGFGRERGGDFERGPRRDQKPVEAGMTRLFVSIGRMDGVRPGDLVGAIAGESGIEGSSIGAIDIYSRYSFVEVPERQGERVIRAISGATVRGRQVTVRPALPPGERPARPVHLESADEGYGD